MGVPPDYCREAFNSHAPSQLFSKVDCDDTELLEHTRELLRELGPQLPDGGGERSDDASDREDTMDVT